MIIQNSTNSNQVAPRASTASDGIHVAGTPTTIKGATQQPSLGQLSNAVSDINKAMQQSNQNMEFSVDSSTQRLIVKVVDSETGKLIRQIPSDETLAIAHSIDNLHPGLLLKQLA